MKLPGIQQGAAQKLASRNVQAPLAEANARIAAFSSLGASATGAMERYADRENTRQLQEATLSVQRDQVTFEQTYGSKVEFNPMEYDDPNFLDALDKAGITDINQKVPAYRIMPEMSHKFYNDSVTRHANLISNKDARDKWLFQQNTFGLKQYLDNSAQASKDQIAYAALQTSQEVSERIQEKDYAGAKLAINTADMDEPSRQTALSEIRTAEQEDYFDETIELNNLADMETALKLLNNNDPKATSDIAPKDQKTYANQLRSSINSLKNVQSESEKTQNKLLVDEGRKIASLAWAGKITNAKKAVEIHKQVSALDPLVAQDMSLALAYADSTKDIMIEPPEKQQARLFAEREGYRNMTTNEAYVYKKQMDTLRQGIQDRKEDSLEYGKRWGIVDFEPIDYDNIGASLFQRIGVAETMENNYKTFTGYLEKSEVPQFAAYINQQDTAGKLNIFKQVYEGMNGDVIKSSRFYEQFKTYDELGTAAIAGQLVSDGAAPVAKKVLEGANLRRQNPDYVKEVKEDIEDIIVKQMGTAFRHNNVQRNLITESVMDAYAYAVHNSGIDKERFDRNTVTKAINEITGGIIDYQGSKFQAPVRGMTQVAVDYWLEDLSSDAFGSTANPEAVKKAINNGDFKLVGVGQNKFRVTDDRGRALQNTDGSSFVLSYNPNYPSIKDAAIQKQLETDDEKIKKGVSKPTSIWESDTLPMIKKFLSK
jgi:hypothetical protein